MIADEHGERFRLPVDVGPIAAEPVDAEPTGGFPLPSLDVLPEHMRVGHRVARHERTAERLCGLVSIALHHHEILPERGEEKSHCVGIRDQVGGQHVTLPQLGNEPIRRKIGKARPGGAKGGSTVPGDEQTDHRPVARLQAARGFERDDGTETMPEENRRKTDASHNLISYALGCILNRLHQRLVKAIPASRQLHNADVCDNQPLTPATVRG